MSGSAIRIIVIGIRAPQPDVSPGHIYLWVLSIDIYLVKI